MKTKTTSLMICCLLLFSGSAFGQANQPGAGNCLKFDGVNDYVDLIALDDDLKGLSQLTVSAWVKLSAVSTTNVVMVQHQPYRGFHIALSTTWFQVGIKTTTTGWSWSTTGGSSGVAINEWVFVSLKWDGVLLKGYINGVEISSSAIGGSFGTNNLLSNYQFRIGRHYWGSTTDKFFGGSVDEVRIWNYARSQSEIRRDMCRKLQGNEPGLVGYWRFDEGSGTTAFDSSPNGNDGTLQ